MKAPSIQFYPKDLMADPDFIIMSMAERGAYLTLIMVLYLSDNSYSLPHDPKVIKKVLSSHPKWKTLWGKIKHKFEFSEDGKMFTHRRVIEERQKQDAYHQRKSEAGKKGAESRWQCHDSANGKRITKPMAKGMAKNGSSSSTSNSIINYTIIRGQKFYTSHAENLISMSEWYHKKVKEKWDYLKHLNDKNIENTIMAGAAELEKLIRLDKHEYETIRDAIKGVVNDYDHTKEFNWFSNLQSLRTIRHKIKNGSTKFEAILTSMKKTSKIKEYSGEGL